MPLPTRLRLSRFGYFPSAMLGLLLVVSHCSAKQWRSIVPLHSSRADVHRLLGSPLRSGKYTSSYELPAEIVEFMFAEGGVCGTTPVDSWRVASDTVINIRVVPRIDVRFQDNQRFFKLQDLQQKNIFYYSDAEDGIRYTVENRPDGQHVLSIDYLPAAADRDLRCSEAPSTQTSSIPIFQQYGVVSPDLEKAILDNFAIQLLNDENLDGYVVLRRGQYSSKFAAQRLLGIRNYLFRRRRVPPSRVAVFEGKPQTAFTIELYLVLKGKLGPT